jgi:hypothetical protein
MNNKEKAAFQKSQQTLSRNGAYGFAATWACFTLGLMTAIADGFNEISTSTVNNADLLSRATDTLMIAGCMTGLFTAAVGTVYYNRRDNVQRNNNQGPKL